VTTPCRNQAKPSRTAAETNDPEAQFRRVYQENQGLLFRYVSSWVGNREDAEDLTADIFLKAAGRVDYARPPKMIRRWLFQVARTTLIDHWRARDRFITYSLEELLASGEREPTEEDPPLRNNPQGDRLQQLFRSRLTISPSPGEVLDEEGEEPAEEHPEVGGTSAPERVQRLLQRLPARYRDVLTCRYLLTLSIRDTARHMGLTVANVKVMQSRALKRAAELELHVSDEE